MKPAPPKTIHDIALQVGVSTSTVSRALRNDPRISENTRRRVEEAARNVGYVPNPLISVLMAHLRANKPVEFQSVIAYLDTSVNPTYTDTWNSSLLHNEAVRAHAARLGYKIDYFWFHDPAVTPTQLTKILTSRGIQGIIIHYLPQRKEDLHSLSLDLSGFAVASLGSKLDAPFIHYACTDHFVIMQQALSELQKSGYQRIGLAMDSYVDNVTENRFLSAFLGWQNAISSEKKVVPFVTNQFTQQHFGRWFLKERPDVIICIDSGVMDWLEDMRISVPEKVGVAHLDVMLGGRDFSGILQNHEGVAAAAVDLITGQLNRNERGIPAVPKAVLLGGRWVEGSTLRRHIAN